MATENSSGFYGRLKSITTQDLADLLEEAPVEGTQLELKAFHEDPPGSGKLTFHVEDESDVLSQMANTAGGRQILGAIEDRNERLMGYLGVPAERRRALLHRLTHVAARVQPPVRFDSHWVEAPGGRGWVLVVSIPVRRGPLHQSASGRYLQRVNSTAVILSNAAVTDAILADAKSGGRVGWEGSPFRGDYPFKKSGEADGRVPDNWFVGALVRAPYPVEGFVDGAGDLKHIEQAFAREQLSPVLRRDRADVVLETRAISVQYNLSARVYRRGRGAPSVTTEEIEEHAKQAIERAARLLAALGYEGPVELHCCLSQGYATPLLLREDLDDTDPARTIMPHTNELLTDDVLLTGLLHGELVAQLAKRFRVCVERNPDTSASV